MKFRVLITPVEPSVDDRPNFTGVLANYEIEASSEAEADDIAFDRFRNESPFRSHNRDDYIVHVS